MAKRKGEWAYSQPFSLNSSYYGVAVGSYKINIPSITVDPVITQWDVTKVSPSRSRHLKTAAAYMKILGSGNGNASLAFPYLDLGPTNISVGSGTSKTRCFTFRLRRLATPKTRIHKIRLWCSDLSDFLDKQYSRVIYETANTWTQNKVLPVSYMTDPTHCLEDSLPLKQNLFRQDGGYTIHGSGDADVSQYVYIALAASGTTPLGEYGSSIVASGFKIRVTYNIDNMDAFWD